MRFFFFFLTLKIVEPDPGNVPNLSYIDTSTGYMNRIYGGVAKLGIGFPTSLYYLQNGKQNKTVEHLYYFVIVNCFDKPQNSNETFEPADNFLKCFIPLIPLNLLYRSLPTITISDLLKSKKDTFSFCYGTSAKQVISCYRFRCNSYNRSSCHVFLKLLRQKNVAEDFPLSENITVHVSLTISTITHGL